MYNFGIQGATLQQDLALLRHFRDTYAIDQVLFYTGGNNAIAGYIGTTNQRFGPWVSTTATFELINAAERLRAPSAKMLQWLDEEVLRAVIKKNSLREGIAAANE